MEKFKLAGIEEVRRYPTKIENEAPAIGNEIRRIIRKAKPMDDRHRWVVETLAVDPSDRILEIGCGNGTAVSMVCSKLINGTIIAVDRIINLLLGARSILSRNVPDNICWKQV